MSGNALEHAEHIAHAGHGDHGKPDRFGLFVGLTMAILGVLLAFSSAMVGSERTSLVQKLVEEEHAHAKYQAQDVKHRMAFLALTQVHATAFGSANPTANKADMLVMAETVNRYLEESKLARAYTYAFPPVIEVHMEAQEEYERGLLLAEIGVVVASIALMMKRREPWFLSILLGVGCVFIVATTMVHVKHKVEAAEHDIKAAEEKYEEARTAHKTTASEEELVKSIILWAGGKAD